MYKLPRKTGKFHLARWNKLISMLLNKISNDVQLLIC